jgi:predicted small integral membrane protein
MCLQFFVFFDNQFILEYTYFLFLYAVVVWELTDPGINQRLDLLDHIPCLNSSDNDGFVPIFA